MRNQNDNFNIKDYVNIIFRRKYSCLLIFISIMVPLVFYVRTMPDTYYTQSQLVIEDMKYSSALTPQILKPSRSFNFYEGIFRSRSFLEDILDSVGRSKIIKFVEDTSENTLRNFVHSSINLSRTDYRSFINISAQASTPNLAYDLARSATNIFQKKCKKVVAEETENMVAEIEKQLQIIRSKLEKAERDYREYRDKVGASYKGITGELDHLQKKYYELKSEKATTEALAEANKRLLNILEKKVMPKKATKNQAKRKLYNETKKQLRSLEKEKKQLESQGLTLTSSSQINKKIELLERKLMEMGRNEDQRLDPKVVNQWQKMRKVVAEDEMALDIINSKISVYEKKIQNYKRRHPDELTHSLELSRLERAKKVYEDTYNILLEKVEEAKIRRASETGGLKVIDSVYYPNEAVPRKEGIYYFAGAIIGIILSLGFAFLREFLDTTIKSNDDIEFNYDVPIIGTIPHVDLSKRKELVIKRKSPNTPNKQVETIYPKELVDFYNDESLIAESYRSLRTNLFFTSPDKPIHVILVTSSGPGEGKSITSSNLSLACAQMGKKVLLIDSDLRRPVLHHLFQHPRENGFTDLFIGKNIKDVIKKTDIKNIDIITAGRFTPNPSELLASKKIEAYINELENEYDLIIFDTPPVMAVTDASILSTKVDGALLVVKSYSTDKNILDRSVNTLNNVKANIIGFVLNDINLSHRNASYGYYKYYYHYYHSQKD